MIDPLNTVGMPRVQIDGRGVVRAMQMVQWRASTPWWRRAADKIWEVFFA